MNYKIETYDEFKVINEKLESVFESIGFSITNFVIENISLPEDVMLAMDERRKMSMFGVDNYVTCKAANAMGDVANKQSGGLAGASFASMMTNALSQTKVKCSHCEFAINESDKFCPNCGKSTQNLQSNCVSCKASIDANSKFCPECGKTQTSSKMCQECGAKLNGTFCYECGNAV